jgi:hypothetical protein
MWKDKPYRSKQIIIAEPLCKSVTPIALPGKTVLQYFGDDYENFLSIAHKDGFESVLEMLSWFWKNHGLPFEGFIIEWEKI